MFFEPSAELRCDYGAYCHALGLVEREELYKSIFTYEERRMEEEARYRETQSPVCGVQVADTLVSSPTQPCNTSIANVGNKPGSTQTSPARRSASVASVRNRKKACLVTDSPKDSGAAAAPSITFIVMRNLKFCLNQRDMKPLALAIQYCISLVSVEFVGCGLSEESYIMLVEALYKSRRVASVTVDFNSGARPGFCVDPTISSALQVVTSVSSVATMSLYDLQQDLSLTNFAADTVDGGARNSIALHSQSFTGASGDSTLLKKGLCDDFITLAPSAYRGLKNMLLAADQQCREEKGRKGRADSKRQTQLQQQLDQLAQIDTEKPVRVPRGWFSMVVTGVKHLSLRGNGITDEDIFTLASILTLHPRSELVSLNLWGNQIGDDGAVALAKVLKENRTLQVLDLGENKIGDVGLLKLVDCFRMQEVSLEKLQAYRKRHLTRRDATARERQLATTLPPQYPAYEELYTAWYQRKYPQTAEDKKESKKSLQTKAKKVETVFTRPSTPFDCECFRVDNMVRVPGNTVLRCVNLGNNRRITVDGAREVLRILSLQEPLKDDEMMASQNFPSEPPELYCASISLRTFVLLHNGEPELLEVQKRLTDVLYEHLRKLDLPTLDGEVSGDDPKKKPSRNKK